jgi:hypothetical protein
MNIVNRLDLSGPLTASDKRRGKPSIIVVHRNTVADTVDAVAQWHRDPPTPEDKKYRLRLFPYHFFVDVVDGSGVVYQVHSLDTVSPHAGPQGWNGPGIGIAVNHDARKSPLPPAMYDALVSLVATLREVTGIKVVVPHKLQGGLFSCPGRFLNTEKLSSDVRLVEQSGKVLPTSDVVVAREWILPQT